MTQINAKDLDGSNIGDFAVLIDEPNGGAHLRARIQKITHLVNSQPNAVVVLTLTLPGNTINIEISADTEITVEPAPEGYGETPPI